MIDIKTLIFDLAWPISLFIAWYLGEIGYGWARLSRISVYAIVGFAIAYPQLGLLSDSQPLSIYFLANIGFGLILFEAGYRVNLMWLLNNPWVAVTSITESTLTFVLVFLLVNYLGFTFSTSLLLAALSMATSPATAVRVINEQRSSGQVTERVLHLSVLNCVWAVFLFKIIVSLILYRPSTSLGQLAYNSFSVLFVSIALGVLFGGIMPLLLRAIKSTCNDNTLAFAFAVILLASLTHYLKLSPVLATLTFGLVSRHSRMVFSPSQKGFGTLGDSLSVLLFVFIAATIEWHQVMAGFGIGLAIIAVRQVAKIIGITLFAHISGISVKKGMLTGVAMAPISVFVILMLEQSRSIGINLVDTIAALAMVTLTLEIIGPLMIQYALVWAEEVPLNKE